jgi:hypothetical protein
MGGQAVGGAAKDAAADRLATANLALGANRQNIEGMSETERALIGRAKLEEDQRANAQKDIARQSFASTFKGSPFDPTGGPKYSSTYMQVADQLAKQGAGRLATAPQYGTNVMDPLQKYKPIDIKDIPGSTGTTPGGLSNFANVASPIMSTIGALLKRQKPKDQTTQGGY